MPDTRESLTHKVRIIDANIGEHKLIIRIGLYEDKSIGEVFVNIGKHGSNLQGMLDGWATLLSIALQSGVDFETVAKKFKGQTFSPQGKTSNKEIPVCTSIIDYVVQYMEVVMSKRSSD